MNPRRKRSWFDRLGSIAGPERVGAFLVILSVWGEGRVHSNAVQADAAESEQVIRARVIRLERRADSLSVRAAYLERQVRRMRTVALRSVLEPEPFGPGWEPAEKGTLMKSVGSIFRHLFFFAQVPNDKPRDS